MKPPTIHSANVSESIQGASPRRIRWKKTVSTPTTPTKEIAALIHVSPLTLASKSRPVSLQINHTKP